MCFDNSPLLINSFIPKTDTENILGSQFSILHVGRSGGAENPMTQIIPKSLSFGLRRYHIFNLKKFLAADSCPLIRST